MVFTIGAGILVGFLFIGIFIALMLIVAYVLISENDKVPSFLEQPKPKKKQVKHHHANIDDWWDRYEDED